MRRRAQLSCIALAAAAALACGDTGKGAGPDAAGPDAGEQTADAAQPDAGAAPDPDGAPADGGTGEACLFQPSGEFNPAIECRWDGPAQTSLYPRLDDVVSTPVVANLTDDDGSGEVDLGDIPDVAFISYQLQGGDCPDGFSCGCCNSSGVLRVVSGQCQDGTLEEHFTVGPDEIEQDIGEANVFLDNSGGVALGDIDADGSIDIVASTLAGGTIAFERDGTVKWYQPDEPSGADQLAASQPSLADIDADGAPEVIQGRVVLNGEDGSLQWRGTEGLGTNGFLGPVSSLGDLDLDGHLNLLAGNTMYDEGGDEVFTFAYDVPIDSDNCQSQGFPCDGFTATGNFDADDEGELVIQRAGTLYFVNHDGTPLEVGGEPLEIDVPVDDCGKNEGGPPTVADFDGDAEPEVGVAGADFYIVADLECVGDGAADSCTDPGIRWKVGNADCSSRVTGSSVFDFDGDGRAEVVYADENFFRVLDGVDGSERLSERNFSHTRLEMPIVVDVDNDGNSEVVFVENAAGGGTTQGIRVLGDDTDSWVPTRRIWNQHGYHFTNVSELGAIPQSEPPNWLEPSQSTNSGLLNNFRQNLPEEDVLAAPDLSVEVSVDGARCAIEAEVCNEGDLRVAAGIPVTFYDSGTEGELTCTGGPAETASPLAPGECETVACQLPGRPDSVDVRACVDNDGYECAGARAGGNNECDEGNNADETSSGSGCVVIE